MGVPWIRTTGLSMRAALLPGVSCNLGDDNPGSSILSRYITLWLPGYTDPKLYHQAHPLRDLLPIHAGLESTASGRHHQNLLPNTFRLANL